MGGARTAAYASLVAGSFALVASHATGCGRTVPASTGDDAGEAGGGPRVLEVVAMEGNEPNGIALQSGSVYWVSVAWDSDAGNQGWGHVQRVAEDGGPVALLGTGLIPFAVATDSTNVYWTAAYGTGAPDAATGSSNGALLSTPLGGGPSTVLLEGLSVGWTIAVQGGAIYFHGQIAPVSGAGADTVYRLAVGGGAPVALASTAAPEIVQSIATDETSVYWVTHAYSQSNVSYGSVVKLPLAGGTPTVLGAAGLPGSLAVGAAAVYWTDQGRVLSVPTGGGAVSTLAAIDDQSNGPIAVDDANVYWATNTQIVEMPLAGGAPVVLATLPAGSLPPTGLAVDATGVYAAVQVTCADPFGCAAVVRVGKE